jgi:branched-subunit amino acid aminotransferase/4-amino-4-deoxychorismate lyase
MNSPLPQGSRAPERAAWVNGVMVRGTEAAISLWDRGSRNGEGLFETLRVYDGVPFAFDRHLERLILSAATLGFPVPAAPDALRSAIEKVCAAQGLRDAVARITITRGIPGGTPTRAGAWVDAESIVGRLWPGTEAGAVRAVCSRVPFEPGSLGAHKTTSRLAYSLAAEEARIAGADEALLISAAGELLEGSVSNVFVVKGGETLTPPLARGILPGITRTMALEACGAHGVPAREATLSRDDLRAADEVFVTNAVQGIVRVGTLDGVAMGDAGVARVLAEDYAARVRAATAR